MRYRATVNFSGHRRGEVCEYPNDDRTAGLVKAGVLMAEQGSLLAPLDDPPADSEWLMGDMPQQQRRRG